VARNYPGAVQFAQQAITIDPEFWIGYIQLAQVYEQLGKADLALRALNNAGRFSSGNQQGDSSSGLHMRKAWEKRKKPMRC